jgi:hypothetical protein
LVASLIQFKCTKYFRDDLTIVLEDAHVVSILFQNHPPRANEFFVARLQCQNNMKLVLRISEDSGVARLFILGGTRRTAKARDL